MKAAKEPAPAAGGGLRFRTTTRSERTVTTYILRRLLYSIPVLFAASFLVFAMVSATGDPARHAEDDAEHLAADHRH